MDAVSSSIIKSINRLIQEEWQVFVNNLVIFLSKTSFLMELVPEIPPRALNQNPSFPFNFAIFVLKYSTQCSML